MSYASVKAWMSGDPVSLSVDALVADAFALMTERKIRHLPIVDQDRRVVGVVSLDDLRLALRDSISVEAPLTGNTWEAAPGLRVEEIMSPSPAVSMANDSLASAADRMADTRIGCLPVVDDDGRLVGLLSETDALRALAAFAAPPRDDKNP